MKEYKVMQQIHIDEPILSTRIQEAYRSLRTNLMFCGADKKVICVTSCMEDEGKSTVATMLAISIAQSGRHVILVDTDMRKSVLTGSLHVHDHHNIGGLSHYLSGQAYVKDIICQTNIPDFNLIFAGPFPPNPAELLLGERFQLMVSALRNGYDYVIIDTPPLGVVTDAAVVADRCDGSVLVIESGAIGYRFAQDIVAQLQRANCPILGTVLNKVDTRHSGGYYGGRYYGKYYGKYGKYGYGYGGYQSGTSGNMSGQQSQVADSTPASTAENQKGGKS